MEYLESKLMDINPVKFVKLSHALLCSAGVSNKGWFRIISAIPDKSGQLI